MWLEYDILYQSFTMLCNQVDLSAIFRWCILHLLDKRLFSFVLCSEYNVSCTCQSNFSFFRFLTHFLFCSLIFFSECLASSHKLFVVNYSHEMDWNEGILAVLEQKDPKEATSHLRIIDSSYQTVTDTLPNCFLFFSLIV